MKPKNIQKKKQKKEGYLRNLPKRFHNSLEYIRLYQLRRNSHNYFLITTQDTYLKEYHSKIRQGKFSRLTYRQIEKNYLIDEYSLNYGKHFDRMFNKIIKNKY